MVLVHLTEAGWIVPIYNPVYRKKEKRKEGETICFKDVTQKLISVHFSLARI